MQKTLSRLALATLAAGTLQAQELKLSGLLIAWYSQMTDNNLRLNGTVPGGYYKLGGTKGTGSTEPFTENGFSIRRMEISLAAKISDELSANVMVDPNQPNPILYDAYLTWKPSAAFEVKMGQFKPIGYEASLVGSGDLLFTDRAQVVRYASDYRDRGVMATFVFGDKAFGGRLGLGCFNGSTDRQNDANAQKDVALRLDLNAEGGHRFGAYAQQGITNAADKPTSPAQGNAFGTASATNRVPDVQEILDNKDKTNTVGAYYAFDRDGWHFDTEVTTGLLGRRNASFRLAEGKAARQHLDQRFLGYQVTGAYAVGHHVFRLRYDVMDYNAGDDWYTTYNPYKESAPGVSAGRDYTPCYTEATAGYTYVFTPSARRRANIKLDYIWRSKNFLAPRAGQSGEQGADSVVVAFQVAF